MTENKVRKLGLIDPSSYSNPEKVKVTHLDLHLDVDFDSKILKGKVDLKCEKQKNVSTSHLVLDIKNLVIHKVFNLLNNKSLDFEIGKSAGNFGSPLVISLPVKDGEDFFVISIEYETSPDASALQWLSPEQTLGKQEPFMFSQCQAIHCRSIIPCQDTPSVKCPFKAEITAPKQLTVLMSGIKDGDPVMINENKLQWKYYQNIPVPSYLIAIAVGRLKGKMLGFKSTVYAEPEIVKESAYEFSETDKMLNHAIKICGPYVWGKYDLLVLPPSFPFGGMENPCLTFVTPTLLAGDKSLANVIAHEIAHSWTGNLVTNKNFEHFWLNEGFTTFVERKIIGAMHGEAHRHFEAILGLQNLEETIVKTLGETNPFTCLVPRLKDVDPDEAFSIVPYEKGHTLLFYLESVLNEEGMFDNFLRAYLEKFKFHTVKTDDFKSYLYEFFSDKKEFLDTIDWDTWFYCPGMPPIIPDYDRSLFQDVANLIEKWRDWTPTDECLFDSTPFNISDFDLLNSAQKCLFLTKFLENEILTKDKLKLMHQVYHMEEVKNSEVTFVWLRVCIKGKWKERIPDALKFVNKQGRMKFVRPIYRDLYNWEDARKTAIENFLQHRQYMMQVLSNQLEKDLGLKENPVEENEA